MSRVEQTATSYIVERMQGGRSVEERVRPLADPMGGDESIAAHSISDSSCQIDAPPSAVSGIPIISAALVTPSAPAARLLLTNSTQRLACSLHAVLCSERTRPVERDIKAVFRK